MFLFVTFVAREMQAQASVCDSIQVVRLLTEAARLPSDSNRILFFAQSFIGVPYESGTLDKFKEERLVVHTNCFDCTTFVETVIALTLCDKLHTCNFEVFKQQLQYVRYRGGTINGYASRLHYVSDWIESNTRKGILVERTDLFPHAVRTLSLDFMSKHAGAYPHLKDNPLHRQQIAEVEERWKEYAMPYIPKKRLKDKLLATGIHDGDILFITTSMPGLDVVHVGFACRVKGELRLLHASSQYQCVRITGKSLFDYLQTKRKDSGIRVISLCP